MNWSEKVTQCIEELLVFAEDKQLIENVDRPYYRNLLLDVMDLDAPEGAPALPENVPDTATKLLREFCDLAVEKGLIENMGYARDLFSARIMGLLTPSPKAVRDAFLADVAHGSAQQATDRFYQMCRACDYIKVDAIAQNVRYFADSPAGELEITINLSKPEKDPKEIAKLKNAPSVGYPKCMLCVEKPRLPGPQQFPGPPESSRCPDQAGRSGLVCAVFPLCLL